MAGHVNATPMEYASVVKDEPHREMDDAQQASETDSRTQSGVASVESSSGSKVSPKQNVDGNGDGKPAKSGSAGKSGSAAKSPENEVFIPAPPPATNAWTKRMQASALVTKPAAESTSSDDKPAIARSSSDSNKPTAAKKPSPNTSQVENRPKNSPQSPTLRLEETTVAEKASLASCKQPNVETAENPLSKQNVEAQPKCGSDVSLKAEVQAKSASLASDKPPGSVWKKPATSSQAHVSPDASSAGKQHTTDLPAGVTSAEEPRRWETISSSQQSSADEHNSESTGLNDSAHWPSLNKATDKSPGSESSPSIVPSSAASDETASDEKTPVVQNHIKRLPDSGGSSEDSHTAKESTSKDSKDVAAENKTQSAKKKGKGNKPKWLPYEIELPKTRRRPTAGRPRASSQERSRTTSESARDGPRDTREGVRRREGRGGGGRDSSERTSGGGRRNRREQGDKAAVTVTSDDKEPAESNKSTTTEASHSDKGHVGTTVTSGTSGTTTASTNRTSTVTASTAHVSYQSSRRSANRGGRGGTFRGRGGSRFQPVWSAPATIQYLQFAGTFDPSQPYAYCHIETPTPTFYTPIVSQSDYYTSILADESAKKLIAQQIEYYFSNENLMKDFFLRRQMDADGWIPVELLASFRRVRIHTGAVNTQLIVDSLTNSKTVEVSEDRKHMRTRDEPGRWSLAGVEPTTFSSLDASVPEFVPGQMFRVPPTQDYEEQPHLTGGDSVAVDASLEVSSRLKEMSVSTSPAAESAQSKDSTSEVISSDADAVAGVEDSEDTAVERLNTSSDDKQHERLETPKSSSMISEEQLAEMSIDTETESIRNPSLSTEPTQGTAPSTNDPDITTLSAEDPDTSVSAGLSDTGASAEPTDIVADTADSDKDDVTETSPSAAGPDA